MHVIREADVSPLRLIAMTMTLAQKMLALEEIVRILTLFARTTMFARITLA